METWIKLYRKFDEWEWFNISEMVHLFIYLLLNANNTDNEWRGVKIKRGQIITGRKSLNEKTGISEQTLRTCLKRLENTKEITIKSTNHFSIITVCNYEVYQGCKNGSNQQTNQQLTSDQPATNQQLTTIKEYKNDNNEKNEKNIIAPFENFWNLYDKDEDRILCETLWMQLPNEERIECITKLPEYIEATIDKQFRKSPKSYLKNKSWRNEIIKPKINGFASAFQLNAEEKEILRNSNYYGKK